MMSVCVPTVEESLEEKVRTGEPELVEIVTWAGLAPFSCSVTEVKPQIEDVVNGPYYLLTESFKKGYVMVFELPIKETKALV